MMASINLQAALNTPLIIQHLLINSAASQANLGKTSLVNQTMANNRGAVMLKTTRILRTKHQYLQLSPIAASP